MSKPLDLSGHDLILMTFLCPFTYEVYYCLPATKLVSVLNKFRFSLVKMINKNVNFTLENSRKKSKLKRKL